MLDDNRTSAPYERREDTNSCGVILEQCFMDVGGDMRHEEVIVGLGVDVDCKGFPNGSSYHVVDAHFVYEGEKM